MMLTGGLMMAWAALLFFGLPLAIVVVTVGLILRGTSAGSKDQVGAPNENSK
jgi:hypothetical protein